MVEAAPKHPPGNDNGSEAVTLQIKSSIDKTSEGFEKFRPTRFTESHQNENSLNSEEGETLLIETDSLDGLQDAKVHLGNLRSELSEWEASENGSSEAAKVVLEYMRVHISDIHDLIRYQNEALSLGADNKEIQERAERIADAINALSQNYENLATATEDDSGTALRELADSVNEIGPNEIANIVDNTFTKAGDEEPPNGLQSEVIILPDLSHETLTATRQASSAYIEGLASTLSPEQLTAPDISGLYQDLQILHEFNRTHIDTALAGEGMPEIVRLAVKQNMQQMAHIRHEISELIAGASKESDGGAGVSIKKLNNLEKSARRLVNEGLIRQKSDYSEHLPDQNKQLIEMLFLAREEVIPRIAALRQKLSKREAVEASEVAEVEVGLQRMQKAFDMLPSVNNVHSKEDYERPKNLSEAEIEELKHLSTKTDVLPWSLDTDLTQEKFLTIQDDYEKLQVLTESVQEGALRILTQGSYLSREKEVLNRTLGDILQIRRKIEAVLQTKENVNEAEEVEGPLQERSSERKNFVAYPISKDTTTRKTIHVNGVPMGSYPVEKNGVTVMSHKNPEELFPESETQKLNEEKPELNSERIEEYRDWLDTPETQQTPDALGTSSFGDVDNLANTTSPPQGEILPSETDSLYSKTREEWRESGQAHLEAHRSYRDALTEYYASLQEQSLGEKLWTRTKATFGFKPELPEAIAATRDDMFAKTETYNALAQKMVEQRARGGKEQASEKVLERYRSMLARTLLLNTFDEQLSTQKKATEDLAFVQSEFMKKHSKAIRFTGAAAIGGLTGGLFGAGAAVARTLTGAAVTGVTTGAVGEWQDKRVNRISDETAENRAIEISSIESMLKRGSLTKEELEESYRYLSEIYHKVDKATQVKIAAILATVIASSLLLGEVADAVLSPDSLGDSVTPNVEGNDSQASPTGEGDRIVVDAGTQPDAAPIGGAGAAKTLDATEYTAQRGDNLWDIMEGQTDAGKPAYLDHVAEADRQRLIALVAERVNQDDSLRAGLGFGETANDLQIGAEVDTEELNQMAEEIAKEKGMYIDNPVTPTADAAPEAGNTDAATSPDDVGVKAGGASEKVIMKSASVSTINEYARAYTGGYVKFEQDFEKLLVEKIQGPTPATSSLFSFIFGGAPNTTDAYKLFSPYTISDFNELSRVDEPVLTEALAQDGIDISDYRAWQAALGEWKAQGMTINPNDRFEDVAKAAFINSLNQPKAA